MTEIVTLPGGNRWQVGDTRFTYRIGGNSTADELVIRKPPELVERYTQLCRDFCGSAIVELGIAAGGSTALITLLARPQKIVACELADAPVAALTAFIDAHDAVDIVRPYYGVNQADRVRLAKIIDSEFAEQRLDLVIDDASHMYAQTKASFEVLFPRLRPGGRFVIEDWTADYMRAKWVSAAMSDTASPSFREHERRLAEAIEASTREPGPPPLHHLGTELLQISATSSNVVSEMTTNENWIVVERGPAEIDPATFHIADHYEPGWAWAPE